MSSQERLCHYIVQPIGETLPLHCVPSSVQNVFCGRTHQQKRVPALIQVCHIKNRGLFFFTGRLVSHIEFTVLPIDCYMDARSLPCSHDETRQFVRWMRQWFVRFVKQLSRMLRQCLSIVNTRKQPARNSYIE